MSDSYTNRDEDWSDDFDDRDSDDWEEHYSISEGDEADMEYEMIEDEQEYDDEEEFSSEGEPGQYDEDGEDIPYLVTIIDWLKTSTIINCLDNDRGFFVCKGIQVCLGNNEAVDLMEWLVGEGVDDLAKIGNYTIIHINSPYTCEVLVFVNTRPFLPNAESDEEVLYANADENILF